MQGRTVTNKNSAMTNLPQSEPRKLSWRQYVLRTLLIAVALLIVPVGLYCRWAHQLDETRDLKDRILATVESLEAKRPPQ